MATIAGNLIEGIVAVTVGIVPGSIALVGFGIDSAIEVASSVIIVRTLPGPPRHRHPPRRRRALRLIAISFYGLAAYVSVQAIIDLAAGSDAFSSPVGIVLARPLPSRDALLAIAK